MNLVDFWLIFGYNVSPQMKEINRGRGKCCETTTKKTTTKFWNIEKHSKRKVYELDVATIRKAIKIILNYFQFNGNVTNCSK